MTGDLSQFIKIKPKSSDIMTFGDDMKSKTIEIGDIGKIGEILVYNVLLVDNLSYNLLSGSQLYD